MIWLRDPVKQLYQSTIVQISCLSHALCKSLLLWSHHHLTKASKRVLSCVVHDETKCCGMTVNLKFMWNMAIFALLEKMLKTDHLWITLHFVYIYTDCVCLSQVRSRPRFPPGSHRHFGAGVFPSQPRDPAPFQRDRGELTHTFVCTLHS